MLALQSIRTATVHRNPVRIHWRLLLLCFLFLVYDNYYVPLNARLFDLLGVFLLLLMAAFGGLRLHKGISTRVTGASLSMFVSIELVLAVVQGLIIQHSLSAIPFLMGMLIYFLLRKSAAFEQHAYRILLILIWLASLALIFQYLVYKLTGHMYSMLAFYEGDFLRSSFGDTLSRPTGFYVEPSSHASTMIMLLWLYVMRIKRISLPVVVGCVSLLLSQSFLAVGYLVAFIVAFGLFMPTNSNVKTNGRFKYIVLAVVAMAGLFAVLSTKDSTFEVTVMQRFETIKMAAAGEASEGSFSDRMGPLADGSFVASFMEERNLFQVLFGEGISSKNFQEKGGVNTISWLVTSFGLVGTALLLSYVTSLIGYNAFGVTFVFLMMLPYPLASYAFQWLLLAILAVHKRQRIADNVSHRHARETHE